MLGANFFFGYDRGEGFYSIPFFCDDVLHPKPVIAYPLVMTNGLLLKPWPSRNSGFSHSKWWIFQVRYVTNYQIFHRFLLTFTRPGNFRLLLN